MRPTSDDGKPPRLRIDHPDQLLGLSPLPLKRHRGSGPIRITDERVEPKVRERWEAQLNRLYFACGCPEGTLGLLLGLVVYGAIAAFTTPSLGSAIGFGLLSAFMGSAAGKLAGLARANARLKQVVAEVRREWDAPNRVEGERYACG